MHLSQFGTLDSINRIFGYARIRQNPALGAHRSRFISALPITICGFELKTRPTPRVLLVLVALAALAWSLIACKSPYRDWQRGNETRPTRTQSGVLAYPSVAKGILA
jgi:hypothetical protein